MIVDLVRNDLSHTATKEAFKWKNCVRFTFKQVPNDFHDCFRSRKYHFTHRNSKNHFSNGKHDRSTKDFSMQIIEALEETKRGLYSGAVGYFTPTGDFDFNVVIRSILYNAQNQYLSFSVGSAITSQAIRKWV